MTVQLTRNQIQELDLKVGDTVYLQHLPRRDHASDDAAATWTADRRLTTRPMSLFSNGSVHISAKTDYAIRATVELAAAGLGRLVTAHAIADAKQIPLRFLLNILADLRRVGLVDSRRGRAVAGGWPGRRRPITIADCLRAVDGPLAEMAPPRPRPDP